MFETAVDSPRAAGLMAPARTGRHERTLVAWPTDREVWGAHRDRAVDEYAALVAAIAPFEPVTVVADPARAAEASERCGALPAVDVLEIPIDDSWIRDSGPIYLVGGAGGRAVTQFGFNAWGGKYMPYDRDADLPRRLAEATQTRRYTSDLVMEGGGFTVDGEGTLITTESVVLNDNRNPGWTRERAEQALRDATGAETILWLAHGLAEDRDTDGHSDNVVQFAAPGRVVVQVTPDHEPLAVDFIRHDLFLAASRINDRHGPSRHRFNGRDTKMFLFRGILIGVKPISGRMPVNRCATV